MGKERVEDLEEFVADDCQGRRSEGPDDRQISERSEDGLQRVMPNAGGEIHVDIGVVYAVDAPQGSDGMKEVVLDVAREVES